MNEEKGKNLDKILFLFVFSINKSIKVKVIYYSELLLKPEKDGCPKEGEFLYHYVCLITFRGF